MDFVINANQAPDAYWIYFKGNQACSTAIQGAILRYDGSPNDIPQTAFNPDSVLQTFPDIPVN